MESGDAVLDEDGGVEEVDEGEEAALKEGSTGSGSATLNDTAVVIERELNRGFLCDTTRVIIVVLQSVKLVCYLCFGLKLVRPDINHW